MPSEVTLHLSPHTPVAFPPICCVCLAPATTTHPVQVWMYKVRYPPHLKVTRRYPLPVPYCEAHGRAARHLSRYERGATLALVIAGIALLIVAELTLGRFLRELGGIAWWGATVLAIALLTFSGAVAHQVGRRLLQHRSLAPAHHLNDGSLGVATTARVVRHASPAATPLLAVTFTFANDTFAAQVAALHGVDVGHRGEGSSHVLP